jgi:hypothetical protein
VRGQQLHSWYKRGASGKVALPVAYFRRLNCA